MGDIKLLLSHYGRHCFIISLVYNGTSKEQGMAKKKVLNKSQQRSLRTQQIIMGVIGVMIILAMVLSLVAR